MPQSMRKRSKSRTQRSSTCSAPAPPAAAPPAPVAASSARTTASKEARLRELKHFYDEGLVSEDVYRNGRPPFSANLSSDMVRRRAEVRLDG